MLHLLTVIIDTTKTYGEGKGPMSSPKKVSKKSFVRSSGREFKYNRSISAYSTLLLCKGYGHMSMS